MDKNKHKFYFFKNFLNPKAVKAGGFLLMLTLWSILNIQVNAADAFCHTHSESCYVTRQVDCLTSGHSRTHSTQAVQRYCSRCAKTTATTFHLSMEYCPFTNSLHEHGGYYVCNVCSTEGYGYGLFNDVWNHTRPETVLGCGLNAGDTVANVAMTANTGLWVKGDVTLQLAVNSINPVFSGTGISYSFDGGSSWNSSGSKTVSENGTYTGMVKDSVGNIVSKSIEVKNIDKVQPVIASIGTEKDPWYEGSQTISVQAEDLESGMDSNGYSFDGGNTWQQLGSIIIEQSGTFSVAVRDAAGNVTASSVTVTKLQPPVKETPNTTEGSGSNGNSASTGNSGSTGNNVSTGNSGSTGNSASTGNSGNTGNSASTGNSVSTGNGGSTGNSASTGNNVSTEKSANAGSDGNKVNSENMAKTGTVSNTVGGKSSINKLVTEDDILQQLYGYGLYARKKTAETITSSGLKNSTSLYTDSADADSTNSAFTDSTNSVDADSADTAATGLAVIDSDTENSRSEENMDGYDIETSKVELNQLPASNTAESTFQILQASQTRKIYLIVILCIGLAGITLISMALLKLNDSGLLYKEDTNGKFRLIGRLPIKINQDLIEINIPEKIVNYNPASVFCVKPAGIFNKRHNGEPFHIHLGRRNIKTDVNSRIHFTTV